MEITYMWSVEVHCLSVCVGQRNPPAKVGVASRPIAVWQVTPLGDFCRVRVVVSANINDGVADLKCPPVHNIFNWDFLWQILVGVCYLRQSLPQVILLCVSIFVPIQIACNSILEAFLAQKQVHHAENNGTFWVTNGVENLWDLIRMTDCCGDRMRCFQSLLEKTSMRD